MHFFYLTLKHFLDIVFFYYSQLYRRLKTTVSLVYAEFWTEDPMEVVGKNLSDVLENLKEYAERKISRISVDATHLLT